MINYTCRDMAMTNIFNNKIIANTITNKLFD